MNKLFAVLLLLSGGTALAQVEVTATPPPYGYFVLAGSTHRINVTVTGEVDTITAWSESSAGTAVLTANNTLTVGDVIAIHGLSSGRAGDLNEHTYKVSARTPTTITISGPIFQDQATTPDSGVSKKIYGAGFTGLVNWTKTGANAGSFGITSINASHASSLTSAEPWVDVTANASGTCSVGGTIGAYTPTSTMMVNLVATSVDDPTKSVTIPYGACGATVQVFVAPSYVPLFKNGGPAGTEDVQSWVLGAIDQRVTWNKSGAGCGTLADTDKRDALFVSGSTQGRCTLTATSVADPTKSDHAVMYVASTTSPYNVTARGTKPIPCEVDPAMTGTLYRVGPGRPYTTPAALPLNALTSPGNTVLIDPGTYTNYIEIEPLISGTASPEQPTVVMIGCADASGNLPVFEASNATGASWVSTPDEVFAACTGQAMICLFRSGSYQLWSASPVQPAYVFVGGLTIQNARNGFAFKRPNGTDSTWAGFSSCIRANMGAYQTFYGMELKNCGQGTFTDFNGNHMWGGFSGAITIEGNNISSTGVADGATGSHDVYEQSWMTLIQGNTITGEIQNGGGAQIKSRGIGTIIRYNRLWCEDTPGHYCGTRTIDLVEVQDAPLYITLEGYIGGRGQTECGDTPFCQTPTDGLGMAGVISWQEMRNDLVYGNTISTPNGSGNLVHFNGDHAQGSAEARRRLYYYSNSSKSQIGTAQMFDTGQPGGSPVATPEEWQQIYMANNIHWGADNSVDQGCCYTPMNRLAAQITTMQTNMWWSKSAPSLVTPINTFNTNGWTGTLAGVTGYDFSNEIPVDLHVTGLSSANVITTPTQPFVDGTFLPITNAPQNGLASTITGFASGTPVRLQINSSGYLTPRQNLTMLGAVDSGPAPAPISIALAVNPISLVVGTNVTLVCTTTLSDTTTRPCLSPVLASTNTASATVSGLVVTATATTGTGSITATAEGLTAASVPFTVSAAPPVQPRVQGAALQNTVIQ